MPRVGRRFILNTKAELFNRRGAGLNRADWASTYGVDLIAVSAEVQRQLASGEIDLVSVGVDLFQLGFEVRVAQEKAQVKELQREGMRVEADEVLKRAER